MKNNETFTYEIYDEDNPRIANSELRDTILSRDGYTCRYCGCQDSQFHIDHVYPYSKGGRTEIRNLVTACQKCNQKKYNSVGIWPKPIGYFQEGKNRVNRVIDIQYHLLISIIYLICGIGGMIVIPEIYFVNMMFLYLSAFLFLSTFWRMPSINK